MSKYQFPNQIDGSFFVDQIKSEINRRRTIDKDGEQFFSDTEAKLPKRMSVAEEGDYGVGARTAAKSLKYMK